MQAANGYRGILFSGLRRGINQVNVSGRQVRLSFGVELPMFSTLYLFALEVSTAPTAQSTELFSSSGAAASLPSVFIMREK